MTAQESVGDELRRMVQSHAAAIGDRFRAETRPRLVQLLTDASILAVRKASGEDTTTAEIALEASIASVAREERSVLQLEARTLALNAALAVLARLAGG